MKEEGHTMKKRADLVVACLVTMATAGCVPLLPTEDKPCPCGAGWRCDDGQGVCVKADSGGGSCTPAWETMTSGATDLAGIWGASPTDVFAVGPNANIVHYDGTAWTPMTSPTQFHWMAVWGASSRDVFAVGGDWSVAAAIHYDGSSWKAIDPAVKLDLGSVWGTSPTDVFAGAGALGTGGHGGMILHYDGSTWTQQYVSVSDQEQVMDVWGLGPRNVFAVGRGGDTPGCPVRHYDGLKWSEVSAPYVLNLWAVHGQANEVLAAGDTILRCDASRCVTMDGAPRGNFMDIWVAGPDCVYAVGEDGSLGQKGSIVRFDGKTWNIEASGMGLLRGIWAADCEHVFVAASDGTVLRKTCK